MASTDISGGKGMKVGGARLGLAPANHIGIILRHLAIKGRFVEVDDHWERPVPRALSSALGQEIVAGYVGGLGAT